MIDNNFNGTMKIDHNGRVEMVNLVMESILGKEAFEVKGKLLADILPGFEMGYIQSALHEGKTTFSYMMRIHDMGYAVNISPTSVDGKVTCVYLTFQEQEQIRQLDHKLMF